MHHQYNLRNNYTQYFIFVTNNNNITDTVKINQLMNIVS